MLKSRRQPVCIPFWKYLGIIWGFFVWGFVLFCFLSFLGFRVHLHSLARGLCLHLNTNSVWCSNHSHLCTLTSSFKDLCNCIWATKWKVNLSTSRSLIITVKSFCHLRQHIYTFQSWRCGHLWAAITLPLTRGILSGGLPAAAILFHRGNSDLDPRGHT